MITSSDVRDAFHYLFVAELPALKQLALSLPHNPLVINIGAGSGTSGLAFLESRPDLRLITIDIQEENSPFGCLYAERDVVRRAGLYDTWGVRWWQIHEDSSKVGREWATQDVYGSPNLVFVDGGHQEEECRADIEAWWPWVVPGGIMAVHDYAKERISPTPDGPHWRAWPGVNLAVDDLLLRAGYEMVLYVDSLIAFRKPIA